MFTAIVTNAPRPILSEIAGPRSERKRNARHLSATWWRTSDGRFREKCDRWNRVRQGMSALSRALLRWTPRATDRLLLPVRVVSLWTLPKVKMSHHTARQTLELIDSHALQVWNKVSTVFPDFTHPNSTRYWTRQFRRFHDAVPFDGAWIVRPRYLFGAL